MAMELAEKIKHDSGVTPEVLRPALITGGGLSLPRYHPKYTLDKFRYTEGYNNFGANLDDEADKVRNSVKKKFDERTLYYGDDDIDDVLLNETRANGIKKEEIRETVVREMHTTVAPVNQPDEQSCGDCCNCCCVWLPSKCCPCCMGEKMRSNRATRATREHTREHIRTGGRYDDCFCWRHTCCRSSSGPNDLCSPWYTSMMALSIKLVAVVCLLLLVLGIGLAAGLGALDNIKSTKYDNTSKTTTSVSLISGGNNGQSTVSGSTGQPKSASTLSSGNITGNPPLQNNTIPPVNRNNSYTTGAGNKQTTAGNITVAQVNVTNSPTNSILNTTSLALNTTVSSLNNSSITGLPQNFMSTFGDNIVNTADISLANSTAVVNNIISTVGAPAPSTSQASQIITTKNIPIAQVVTSAERNNITSEDKTTAKILVTSKAAAATTAVKSLFTTASNVEVVQDTTPADIGLDTESVTGIFNFVPQETTLLTWP